MGKNTVRLTGTEEFVREAGDNIDKVSEMPTPREYVENIKNRQISSDKEYVLDSLTGAIDRLQKAFPRYGSFLMEFVQNADDAKSKSLKIKISQNAIRIFNDGLPFSEEDVKSICKVGRSSKTPKDYIGYLGVGFKAVFLISKCPEIYSGDFQFKFDKDSWDDPAHTPWQVIPLWIDDSQGELSGKYKTIFNLPLKEVKLIEKLREEVRPEHLSDRILLFLRNVKEIEIIDDTRNFKRRIVKSELSKKSDYEIYQIQEYENDILKNQGYWLIFRSVCEVPKEVKEDYLTKEWERENVEKREVLVAYRLGEENKLVVEEKGTAHIGVFSFLPLKEIPSGLNFLIQADFLTMPGRGELARECLWNEWLADEIHNLIISKCIPTFLKNEKWKMNFTQILYSPFGGHELFENRIKRPLREFLENSPIIISEDGSIVKPDEAVKIDSSIRGLITDSDLGKLYPGRKILHPNCQVPGDIERRITEGPTFNASSGVSSKMQELVDLNAQEKNIDFFEKFYGELSGYAESTLRNSLLTHQNIILTDDQSLADSRLVYVKPEDLIVPEEIKRNFRLVHPKLTIRKTVLEFLKKLGVTELTQDHIQDISKKEKLPEISENWENFSNEEKIKNVEFCKDLWKGGMDARDLSFLTLKTKSGKWLKPSELIFPKEYKPEHNIEKITEKGLLDLPIEFASAEFIKDKSDDEIKKWNRFLKELGVDNKIEREKGSIVQRIGILEALQFEKSKGRTPRELGESEKLGYDIESKSGTEEIYVEVKSSSRSDPDIFLTTNELRALQSKQDKYFVYVVKDALRTPTLCVTLGGKLLGITDIKTIIPFSKWWSSAKEEEFLPW